MTKKHYKKDDLGASTKKLVKNFSRRFRNIFRNIRHKTILRHVTIKDNANVLDTSCQDGGFLQKLSIQAIKDNKKISCFGVDMSIDSIEEAQKYFKEAEFSVAHNSHIPYEEGIFDVVISSMTLHHIQEPEVFLSEVSRVLKKKGILYFVDIVAHSDFQKKIFNTIKCPEPYHFEKYYSHEEVEKLLNKNNFRIEKYTKAYAFPAISIVMPVTIFKVVKINLPL